MARSAATASLISAKQDCRQGSGYLYQRDHNKGGMAVRPTLLVSSESLLMPIPHASQALSRFTVLDLTRVRAGPTCVRQLADWGANVIKIDALLDETGGE